MVPLVWSNMRPWDTCLRQKFSKVQGKGEGKREGEGESIRMPSFGLI
jgi:hypothetical protein